MAKVEYVDLLPSEEIEYYRNLTAQDRFTFPRVTKKFVFYSRKKKKGLSARSLLPIISAAWNALSDAERTAWGAAAAEEKAVWSDPSFSANLAVFGYGVFGVAVFGTYIPISNLSGWRLFVQDQSARIKNDFAGVATPSLFHQSWIGNLKIEAPASELKIVQLHPRSYWVSHKVYGKKGMYEPVLVVEDFSLPLVLTLNYSSNLSASGANPSAKFYADVWSSYQGVDIHTLLEIPLDLVADWKTATATLTSVIGYVVGYTLYFHLHDLTGDLYFDNVKAEHGGQNWVRDPFCQDILQGFTRAFYQIPEHWAAITLPAGASYDTIYKDF